MRLFHFLGCDTLPGILRAYAVLLVSVPLGLAVGFFFFFQRGQVLDVAQARLAGSLAEERAVIDSWAVERVHDVSFLAGLEVARRGDRMGMEAPFHNYMATYRHASAVVYADPEGDTVVDSSGSPRVNVADREYFVAARDGRSVLVSGLIGRTSGKPICIIATPVTRPDGQFGGAIFLVVQLSSLDAWLRESTAGTSGGTLLSDASGRVLAPSGGVEDATDRGRVPAMLLAAGETGVRYVDEAGREMIGATVPLQWGGWRLSRAVPVAVVLAGYRRQLLWVGLGALATLCGIIPLVSRLGRHLERPLAVLTRHAEEMRQGGYDSACVLPRPGAGMPREFQALYAAFSDMSCQIQAHILEAERRGVEDALTGLFNRRFLYDSGSRILEAGRRDGRPCTCLMVDVDFFKSINDTHGHRIGDQALVHLAGVLSRGVRKADLVVRYGGEEFAVLLPGANVDQAAELAERLRRDLAATSFQAEGRTISLTVSIGVALARERVDYGDGPLDDLLARADAALYAAKAAGRNRVMVSEV